MINNMAMCYNHPIQYMHQFTLKHCVCVLSVFDRMRSNDINTPPYRYLAAQFWELVCWLHFNLYVQIYDLHSHMTSARLKSLMNINSSSPFSCLSSSGMHRIMLTIVLIVPISGFPIDSFIGVYCHVFDHVVSAECEYAESVGNATFAGISFSISVGFAGVYLYYFERLSWIKHHKCLLAHVSKYLSRRNIKEIVLRPTVNFA